MPVMLSRAALCLGIAAMPFSAAVAEYPERPVRVIVGLTAGSGVDIMARMVGQKLAEALGQPFIIENRPGAGSNIATRYAAQQPPDGYTIFVATVANAINATLYKNLSFDVLQDFAPVILAASASNLLVVNPSLPAKSVGELIALAKAQPGRFTVGSSGIGTAPQMTAELFRQRAGIKVVDVPFKGGPEATIALLGGQIDYLFAITSTALPHVKDGRLRALGVTSAKRSALLPEVPTIADSGLPDFEAVTWFGFAVPRDTPPAVVARLNNEIGNALAAPEIKDKLEAQGIEVAGGTPEQFGRYMRDEFAKWGRLVQQSGLSIKE
jgi:tripartite-type tricarboxylate transporter receptor subunit TctC